VPFEWEGAKGTVFARVVGDFARESSSSVTPVLLIGSPGVGYDYLENLEALTVSDRRVVELAFAGSTSGSADALVPEVLLTADACAAQARAAVDALALPSVHVVAHGMGALVALRLLARPPAGASSVRSLALISPFGALADLRPGALGSPAAADLAATLLPVSSANARASCVAEAKAASNGPLLPRMLSAGGADRLGGIALSQRLAAAMASGGLSGDLPVLLGTGGPADIVEPSWTDLPPTVRRAAFEASGHLPMIEQRDEMLQALLVFWDAVEGKRSNRELKFADAQSTLGVLQEMGQSKQE
jgi:pimeloyl-ACP methyl ester carboxylesterase